MYATFHHYLDQIRHAVRALWFYFANVSVESLASDARVRQVGLIYSVYRFVISTFLMMTSYAVIKTKTATIAPSLTESMLVSSYLVLSLFLLVLFYVVPTFARRQLMLGFFADIILLTAYSIHGNISDLQIILLYMIVVSTSFMVLPLSRAGFLIVFSVIAILYQHIFQSFSTRDLGLSLSESLLLSICVVAVGFLSWSVSQRLTNAEESIAKQAQEVEKLNAINHIVVKNMVNGVLVINENRDIVMVNETARRLLRLPQMDLDIYNSPKKMVDLARLIVQQHPALIRWYRTINPSLAVSWIYELTPDSNNPSDKLRLNNRPLSTYGQLIIIEDIGREQSHAQKLKLESLGQLSASIAHEIRNPLGAISQASQLLMEHTQADDSNAELYQMIFQQTRRVNDIIEDVLSLSRQEIPDQEPINLYHWVSDFVAQHYYDKNILIYASRHEHHTIIYFDPNHLEQIMINLVNNALRHTIPTIGRADVEIHLNTQNDQALIDIIDNGHGVPDNEIPQLFHPFFTTSKKGTGLGLYLSQSFSEANNAKIRYLKNDRSCFRIIASTQKRVN
ncbi:MAG: ATP-binding protein [Moraxella sp.]|nr:ATP-binding protein [Moraxella sp.]